MNYDTKLPTLGRDVQVGNLYNYFTDEIETAGALSIPDESITRETLSGNVECFYFLRDQDSLIQRALNVNMHVDRSFKNGHIDQNYVWFSRAIDRLRDSKAEDTAVVAIIRIVRQIATIQKEFSDNSIEKYCLGQGGLVTHLIDRVAYGTELLVYIQEDVVAKDQTKSDEEKALLSVAKAHLREVFEPNSYTKPLQSPTESIGKISCTIYSSDCDASEQTEEIECSLGNLSDYLREQLAKPCSECKSIYMNLRAIPSPVDAIRRAEKMNDLALDLKSIQIKICELLESGDSTKHIAWWKKNTLEPISHLTMQLEMRFNREKDELLSGTRSSDWLDGIIDMYSSLFDDVNKWLSLREMELAKLTLLLGCIEIPMVDLAAIENHMTSNNLARARVFYLRCEFRRDDTLERIQTTVGQEKILGQIPQFPIVHEEDWRFQMASDNLKHFDSEAERNANIVNCRYYIIMTPADGTFQDGDMKWVDQSTEMTSSILNVNKLDSETLLTHPTEATESSCKEEEDSVNLDDCHAETQSASPASTSNAKGEEALSKCEQSSELSTDDESRHPYRKLQSQVIDDAHLLSLSTDNSSSADDSSYGDLDEECQTVADSSKEKLGEAREHMTRVEFEDEKSSAIEDRIKDPPTTRELKQTAPKSSKQTSRSKSSDTARSVSKSKTTHSDELKKSEKAQTNTKGRVLAPKFDQETTSSKNRSRKNTTDASAQSPTSADLALTVNRNKMRSDECESIDQALAQKEVKLPTHMELKEVYAEEQYDLGKLVEAGKPNVFLLKARKRQQSNVNLRQFDIRCPADSRQQNHKVIILMGATGCGKSTLINGMVNYILGVEWSDPFRFKCVREDRKESVPVNQAHSQTKMVTSYTLSWHDGMKIPFSITIIDTPGYGDTRGVKRDKAITKRIHQFLTDAEINEIHAVCFVAASGDSRLTATQRYIIDSVLSIFGKDVKDNIRLLVTFADNLVPPVVEACKESSFPVTSKSGQVLYSKFNSSVLYANNGVKENGGTDDDDDFNVDELFWDMGYENFIKFFDMLENMEGKDLTTTRRVIQSRDAIEQMLEEIKDELEVCLTSIEDIEAFRTQLRRHGHNVEKTKNYVTEKTEMKYVKVNCIDGASALNCVVCRDGKGRTCKNIPKQSFIEKFIQKWFGSYKHACKNAQCDHPHSAHLVQDFEWSLKRRKVKTTLYDMKREYEAHCNNKMTTEQVLQRSEDELNLTKVKVFSLLDQVTISVRSLETTALNSNVLGPDDYLSLIKSKVAEEQAPGYMTRLDTLNELQKYLTNGSQTTKLRNQNGR